MFYYLLYYSSITNFKESDKKIYYTLLYGSILYIMIHAFMNFSPWSFLQKLINYFWAILCLDVAILIYNMKDHPDNWYQTLSVFRNHLNSVINNSDNITDINDNIDEDDNNNINENEPLNSDNDDAKRELLELKKELELIKNKKNLDLSTKDLMINENDILNNNSDFNNNTNISNHTVTNISNHTVSNIKSTPINRINSIKNKKNINELKQNENNVKELKHINSLQEKQIEKSEIEDRDIILNDKIISDTSSESGSELDFDLNDFEESL